MEKTKGEKIGDIVEWIVLIILSVVIIVSVLELVGANVLKFLK